MFSKSQLTSRFFFENKRAFYGKPRNTTELKDLVFSADYNEPEFQQHIKAQLAEIDEQIQNTSRQLENTYQEYIGYLEERHRLSNPLKQYEKAIISLKEMENSVLQGIFSSKLNGLTMLTNGPSYAYNTEFIHFFESILNMYKMNFEFKSVIIGQGECADCIYIHFPEKLAEANITFQAGEEYYNNWVKAFDTKLKLIYKDAEDKIETDVLALVEEILSPMINSDKQSTVSRFQPCEAALIRFKELAANHGIQISTYPDKGLLIAEKSDESQNSNTNRY